MSLGDKLKNRRCRSITSVDFNSYFRIFILRILHTLSHHFCIIPLSHFIHVHFRTFAFYNFPEHIYSFLGTILVLGVAILPILTRQHAETVRYYCGAILLDLRVGTLLEEEEETIVSS